jgi:ankyrin repeat protein
VTLFECFAECAKDTQLLSEWMSTVQDGTVRDPHTPLYLAARAGHNSVIQWLADKVGVVTWTSSQALLVAAKHGHASTCRLLLELHPTLIHERDTETDSTALHFGAGGGHQEVVNLLKDSSLSPPLAELRDMSGVTALMVAAAGGYVSIVESLASSWSLTVDMVDVRGWSALMHAAGEGHCAVVDLFMTRPEGMRLLAQRAQNGYTVLMIAAASGHLPVVEMLTRHHPPLAMEQDSVRSCREGSQRATFATM